MGQTFSFRARATVALAGMVATVLVGSVGSPTPASAAVWEFEAAAAHADGGTAAPAISADGRFVAFHTGVPLVAADTNGVFDVYVLDRVAGGLERVSVGVDGSQFTGHSQLPSISADGDRVAFSVVSTELSTEGPSSDVYLKDRSDGSVTWISNSGAFVLGRQSWADDISDDGSTVVWNTTHEAGNFVPGMTDTNGASDVILTRIVGEGPDIALSHELVSQDGDGNGTNNGASWDASVNANGSVVTYVSLGNDTLTGMHNSLEDVWAYRDGVTWPITGVTFLGHDASGNPIEGSFANRQPRVLADGRVALISEEPLAAGDTNGTADVYAWSGAGPEYVYDRLSRSSSGGELNGPVVTADVAADGYTLVFETAATNVVPGVDTNGAETDVYRTELWEGGRIELVDQTVDGTTHAGNHTDPVVDESGEVVAFVSPDGLATGDGNGHTDVVIASVATSIETSGPIELVSRTPSGFAGNAASTTPAMSHDGRYVAFVSAASDLATGGEETITPSDDLFVRDRQTGTTGKMMVTPTVAPNGTVAQPWISGDGRFVAFTTTASNLGASDTDGLTDVYVWDRSAADGAFTLASVRDDETAVVEPAAIAAMSDNGRFVLFTTSAQVTAADTNSMTDLYLRDLQDGTTTLVSARDEVVTQTGHSRHGDISDDGRVVFSVGFMNGSGQEEITVYAKDVLFPGSGIWTIASGLTSQYPVPRIAADGSTTVFKAKRLPGYPDFDFPQIMAYDFKAAGYRLISHSSTGSQDPSGDPAAFTGAVAGWNYGPAAISPDGRFVAFDHTSNDIATTAGTGTDADPDLFVHDRVTDTLRHVNHSDTTTGASDTWSPTVDATGTIVAWHDTQAPYFPSGSNPDQNGVADVYLATFDAPSVPRTIEEVALAVAPDVGGAQAGLDTVPIAGIPVESIPFANVAIGAAPLRSIDLAASPLRSIPLRSIPLRSIPLRSIPLRSITLSQLPLELPGGWAPKLVGTSLENVPLQTVTLGDVYDLPTTDAQGAPIPHPLDDVDLGDVGIESSPLRSIGLASIALGSTPLRSIPLRSIDTANDDPSQHVCPLTGAEPATVAESEANWEALLACLGFPVDLDEYSTLMEIDIAGAPLRSIPLRSIPLRSIDLQSSPLRSIPLRSIELSATPLRSIPLRSIELEVAPLRSIPLRSIPLRSIDVNASPLRSIPLRSIPLRSIVVDCNDVRVDCNDDSVQTLGEVADIDLQLIIGTLGDVGDALAGFTLGDLVGEYGDTTIGDVRDWLVQHTDVDVSLADILVGLLLKTDYPWEQLPVADMGLQNVAPTADAVAASVSYRVTGDPVPGSMTTITVTLPTGARYAPGTSHLAVESATSGFATSLDDPAVQANTLTYVISGDHAGSRVELDLQYRPGVRLAPEQATASIAIDGADTPLTALVDSAPYDVIERQRPDDDPATAPLLASGDTLVVGHIADEADVDYYRIPASVVAGKRLAIDLAVPGVDQDLVLYSPVGAEGVIDAAPLRSIPLRSIAVEDQGSVAPGETVPPETLQDIPLRSIPLRSISANRDATDEHVDVLANEDGDGYYTIQVSGYNGAASAEPYVLRMRLTDPPGELQCTPRTLPYTSTASPSTATSAAAAAPGTNTLFVVNRSRLDATYGQDAGGAWAGARVVDALTTLSGRSDLGVDGHVLVVDDDPAVRQAYDLWDDTQCSPNAANAVVDAIVALVEASHASAGGGDAGHTIPYVVLVGADDVLPQARIPDLTRLSNERDYLPDVGLDNPLAGAFATEHLLSDDPYGDRDPIPWLNRLMYVPDAALGRLVETPDEIIASVQRFQDWRGTLDPATGATTDVQTALVTGYDFLADGADAVADELDANLGAANVSRMISETWTRTDLQDALLGADIPYIAAVNAHFDHYRSLPADGNATHREDDLFTTGNVEDPDADPNTLPPGLDKRLLFSMGCHSGLNVPDVYVSGIEDDDWAQTFARQGAGAYVGNTGFGYGDTAAVALSERLMAEFAERMDGSMTVGEAMVYAKQAYAAQLGIYGAYDEKVLAEATFYGLPMFRVTGEPAAPVAGPKVATTPVATANAGVSSSSFTLGSTDLALTPRTAPDGSTFLTVGDDAPQVTSGRPLTPRTDRDVTADTDVPARGVLLTGLTSSEADVTSAAFARAVVDHSAGEPAVATDVAFPASFASVNRYRDPSGERSQLVLLPGQFVPDGDPTTFGAGTQRRFTAMSGVVYYSDDADVTPPSFSSTSARANATTVTFDAGVTDGDNPIVRVLVLYRDAPGAWRSTELVADGTGGWHGTGPVLSEHVEYLVQAVDAAGNVATTSNKGFLFRAAADATPPTVTVTSPTEGFYLVGSDVRIEYGCADANLSDCSATLNGEPVISGGSVDTSQPRSFNVLEVTGTDAYGNEATATVTFHVSYSFGGFAAPVASGQRTEVKAGSAVPVRWQLTDANGYVSDRSAIVDIRSYSLECGTDEPATATIGSTTEVSGLKYDTETDQWLYVWKTEKEWRGTCRQLVITFADGQTASAVFRLT